MDVTQPIRFREKRTVLEVVNATFVFWRQNFVNLSKIVLFFVGPLVLVDAILFSGWYQEYLIDSLAIQNDMGGFYLDYALNILLGILVSLFLAGLTYEYIGLSLNGTGEIRADVVLKAFLRNIGKYVLAGLIILFAVVAGYILCILPGVFVLIAFSLSFVVISIEKKGVLDAISRSKELISGNWWPTFGLVILVGLVQFALSMVFYVPFYLLLFAVGFNSTEGNFEPIGWFGTVTSILVFIGVYFLQTLQMIAIAFQYFNLVEQKEGAGLMQEIDQIGREDEES